MSAFTLGVLLLEGTAIGLGELSALLQREALLGGEGEAEGDKPHEQEALESGALHREGIHSLAWSLFSLGFIPLDLAGDTAERLADILLRVHDDLRRLEACFGDFFGGIHQLTLDEGHQGTHLAEVDAHTLLEARAHNFGEGPQG